MGGTFMFWVASLVHAVAFFFLLGRIGVVSCGMVKGAQTAAYVLMAHYFWCKEGDPDTSKCIDRWTGAATVLCCTGVLIYSWASSEGFKTEGVASLCNCTGSAPAKSQDKDKAEAAEMTARDTQKSRGPTVASAHDIGSRFPRSASR